MNPTPTLPKVVSTPAYVLPTSIQAVQAINPGTRIAIDTETTDLNPHLGQLRLIQIATEDGGVFVIDVTLFDLDDLHQALNPIFGDRQITKIIQNASFDLAWLWKNGFDVQPPVFDPMLAEQVLMMGHEKFSANLQTLVKKYLDRHLPKESQVSDWTGGLSKTQLDYGARDVSVLGPLYDALITQLDKEDLRHVADLEFRAVPAVAEMQLTGLPFGWEGLEGMTQRLADLTETRRQTAIDTLQPFNQTQQLTLAIAGAESFNLNSPAVIKEVLSNAVGTRLSSIDKDHLSSYRGTPAVDTYLDYKEAAVHLSKLKKLPGHRNDKTSRIHCSFQQISPGGAGRMACRNPNSQNFSARPLPTGDSLRALVRATEGKVLIIADYSQIELRIAAELSNDRRLLEAYLNNEDIHRVTASLVCGVPLDQVTKDQRKTAKPVNFGFLYGSSPQGFRQFAKTAYGLDFSEAEAQDLRNKFFESYTGLRSWIATAKAKATRVDNVKTRFGRRRYLPEDKRYLNVLANTPIQGLGADILKEALALVWQRLDGSEAKLINAVHDEIVVECPAFLGNTVLRLVKDSMEAAGRKFLFKVPVVADAAIAHDWNEK